MNNYYFLKSQHFFYITHLVTIMIISFLPSLAIGQSPISTEDSEKIAPYRASENDSLKTNAEKTEGMMHKAMAINVAYWTFRGKFSKTWAIANAPLLAEQISSHLTSQKASRETRKQLTDKRSVVPFLSPGEFNQRDWNERRELATNNLQDLQSSLIDQELENYIGRIQRQVRQEARVSEGKGYKYNPKDSTLTLPGGKTIPAKDISTPEGFKALGIPPEKFKEFKKQEKSLEQQAIRQGTRKIAAIIKSAKDKAKKLAAKTSSAKDLSDDIAARKAKGLKQNGTSKNQKGINGHTGHTYGTSPFDSDWRPPSFQEILNQQKLFNKRGLSSGSNSEGELKMLSKQYGEDLIGLSSNNIFDMVHRQYLRKRSQLNSTTDFVIE